MVKKISFFVVISFSCLSLYPMETKKVKREIKGKLVLQPAHLSVIPAKDMKKFLSSENIEKFDLHKEGMTRGAMVWVTSTNLLDEFDNWHERGHPLLGNGVSGIFPAQIPFSIVEEKLRIILQGKNNISKQQKKIQFTFNDYNNEQDLCLITLFITTNSHYYPSDLSAQRIATILLEDNERYDKSVQNYTKNSKTNKKKKHKKEKHGNSNKNIICRAKPGETDEQWALRFQTKEFAQDVQTSDEEENIDHSSTTDESRPLKDSVEYDLVTNSDSDEDDRMMMDIAED